MMYTIDRFLYVFFILSLVIIISCSNRPFKPIVIDGKEYCITKEKIFSEAWYSCYLRGISCAGCREKICLIKARDELRRAIERGKDDGRWVRTYGTHRLPEYFPNRELGIVYYHLNEYDKALEYLEKSNEYCGSAKAKFYINRVRRRILDLTGEDIESPKLFLDPNAPKPKAIPVIELSGEAMDDTFVANIIIQVNNEKPLYLMELSQPRSFEFREKILLQSGLNDITIRVLDLLGKEEQQSIRVLVDQEGPMIFFADRENKDFNARNYIRGILYDPSDIARFTINEKDVELTRIETDGDPNTKVSGQVYRFEYLLSFDEWERGALSYRAEDSLKNLSEGILRIFKEEEVAMIQEVYSQNEGLFGERGCSGNDGLLRDDELSRDEPLMIASASKATATDLEPAFPFYQMAKRRHLDTIRIEISQFPQETFDEDISPRIEIRASCQIREIYIKDKPILSMYGLRWAPFLNSILRNFMGKGKEDRFLFHRLIKLEKEGENIIPVVVMDQYGKYWESKIRTIKKTRQIHKIDERSRLAISLIDYNQVEFLELGNYGEDIQGGYQGEETWGDNQVVFEEFGRRMGLTNQIWKAFIDQSRFKVIDHINLPKLLREYDLHRYIGSPFLGHHKDYGIWIDICLLCSVEETEKSFSLTASWVDFETGEIMVTMDVYRILDQKIKEYQKKVGIFFKICR